MIRHAPTASQPVTTLPCPVEGSSARCSLVVGPDATEPFAASIGQALGGAIPIAAVASPANPRPLVAVRTEVQALSARDTKSVRGHGRQHQQPVADRSSTSFLVVVELDVTIYARVSNPVYIGTSYADTAARYV